MKKVTIVLAILLITLGIPPTIQINTQTLETKPLQTQNELHVVQGESTIVNGKVILQPATSVQETYNPQQQ